MVVGNFSGIYNATGTGGDMAKGHVLLNLLVIYEILYSAAVGTSAMDNEEEAIFSLLDPCTPLLEALVIQSFSFIFQLGTKWCGPGDLAKNYRDLGQLSKEDRCCRKHDLCPEQITRGQCMKGLCNSSPFTRSHCECDEHFRRCLQSLKTPAADTIGALYFNIGSNTCFAESRDGTLNSAGRTSETQSESERKDLEVWRKTRAAPSFKSVTRRKTSECSRKQICLYKYYAQQPYVEATERRLAVPAAEKGSQQKRRSSRQSKYTDDQISTIDRAQRDRQTEKEDPPAETISTFLYHLLRTTGVLLPKGL
ncbi:hypothetical protein J437_LFUL016881 [Ladona fulva]|uniref:phospholipase A2 n=1 Tax=Ladona fulva TaxID=123851 RepID=A0A8K0P882_LADFU|nr:hypothetical protein J437_LFUL016881 [Ladona fulva]